MKKLQIVTLFLISLFLWNSNGHAKVLESDSLALVHLYKSAGGENWYNQNNWLSDAPVDDWWGITVVNNRVSWIILNNNNLIGTIPNEIWEMDELSILYLFSNKLSGTIPPEVNGLTKIWRINLNNNDLSGELPPQLGELQHLVFLILSENNFEGYIPESLGNLSNLTRLELDHNLLEGEIPSSIAKIENLDILNLSDNHFSGQISGDFNKLIHLRNLYIQKNRIIDLPDLSGMAAIENFNASYNRLTFEDLESNSQAFGSNFSYMFQDSVGEETYATVTEGDAYTMSVSVGGTANYYLWYKNGKLINGATEASYTINSVALEDSGAYICEIRNTIATGATIYSHPIHLNVKSGIIQDSLALVALYDSTNGDNWTNKDNWLSDSPISEWHGITVSDGRVNKIDLSVNNLAGVLPQELENISKLQTLDLRMNSLSGEIPEFLGNMISLQYLALNYNHFSGEIPASLGSLTNLRYLFLSGNELNGQIPDSLMNLKYLKWLYLDSNQLRGDLPEWLGNLNDLTKLVLGSNNFTGAIPDTIRSLNLLAKLDVSKNNFDYLPDLSGLLSTLTEFYTAYNRLTFEDIEPNIIFHTFSYAPQDSVGEERDTTLTVGDSITFSVDVGGSANHYQWFKDGEALSGDTLSVYKISSVAANDSGTYICQITNDIVTGLTLYSRLQKLHIDVGTAVNDNKLSSQPMAYALKQNYPNPFNPSTKIAYALPKAADVTIAVYNTLGQKVAVLLKAKKAAGYHSLIFNANSLSAGIYYYEIKAGDYHQIKKMVLIK